MHMPDALGEERLIVQKESDGFAHTRERLDLRAPDKEGRRVVVENTRDDSGRAVVWQALEHVAYCSSLKKAEIVEVDRNDRDRWSDGADAVANLCAFVDVEELDDVVLEAGTEHVCANRGGLYARGGSVVRISAPVHGGVSLRRALQSHLMKLGGTDEPGWSPGPCGAQRASANGPLPCLSARCLARPL